MKKLIFLILLVLVLFNSSGFAKAEQTKLFNAERLFSEGLYEDAIVSFTEILKDNEENHEKNKITLRLAESYYLTENYPVCIQILLNAEIDGEDLQTIRLFLLGSSFLHLKDYEKALVHLEKAKENLKNIDYLPQIYFELGNLYMDKGDFFAGVNSYLPLLQNNLPDEVKNLASSKLQLIFNEHDEDLFKQLKEKIPSNDWKTEKFILLRLIQKNSLDWNQNIREVLKLIPPNCEAYKCENFDEVYYKLALSMSENGGGDIEEVVKEALSLYPLGCFIGDCLSILGKYFYINGDLSKAENIFFEIWKEQKEVQDKDEILFFAGKISEKNQSDTEKKERFRKLFEEMPDSIYSPYAYFNYYTFSDYVNGDRAAIKHLQLMNKKFPNSLLLINVNYLIGLDYQKTRKSPQGKIVRHKNLTASIDALLKAENYADYFLKQGNLSREEEKKYHRLGFLAKLERAKNNLAIAEESKGAKQQIYLEYAEEVFKEIIDKFSLVDELSSPIEKEEHFLFLTETEYFLGETYFKNGKDQLANSLFDKMIINFQKASIQRNYFLSKIFQTKSQLSKKNSKYLEALEFLDKAEQAGKGNILSADERLKIWIEKSSCYRSLNQLDESMRVLSNVINDDSVSSLRITAMFLRAEIYELQGRPELAKRQYEAIILKGGNWSAKAQEKLKNLSCTR